jgi:exo-beta-1,3-glucanase (GH17 family)
MRRVLALTGLILLAGAGASPDRPRDAAVERVRAVIGSVRFVAYTPTDLTIVAGQVRPASAQQVRKDLTILRKDFQGLVMYSCADGLEAVPAIARELGFRALILGIWDPQSAHEIANAVRLARAYPELVVGVAVGNEVLLAKRSDWATLRQAMRQVRGALPGVAVTTSEPFYFYLNEDPPDFLSVQDFMLPSIHPLYESWFQQGTTAQAVDFVARVAMRLSMKTGKPLLIKETGLPSGPAGHGFTPARQAEFWVRLLQRLPPVAEPGLVYFEAFDHAWKVTNAEPEFGFRPEEAFWGLYREGGEPKPVIKALRRVWHAQTQSRAGSGPPAR